MYSRASVASIVLIQQNQSESSGLHQMPRSRWRTSTSSRCGRHDRSRVVSVADLRRAAGSNHPDRRHACQRSSGADLRLDLLHRVRALRHAAGRRVAGHAHVGIGLSPPGHTGSGRDLGVQGIATIAIAAEGFGFGPLGSLRTNFTDGTSLTIPDAGRSYDQDGNNLIATDEGTSAVGNRLWTVGVSDTHKQTVIDLLQLVRVIEVGMDVNGDGSPDIDASRISFHGQSAGGRHGTMLAALDPTVNLVTLSGCCDHLAEYGRWNVNQRSGWVASSPPESRR